MEGDVLLRKEPSDFWPKRARGRRACPQCGYERKVMVWLNKDGTDHFSPPLCTVCHYSARAAYYAGVSERFTEKYHEAKEKRDASRRK